MDNQVLESLQGRLPRALNYIPKNPSRALEIRKILERNQVSLPGWLDSIPHQKWAPIADTEKTRTAELAQLLGSSVLVSRGLFNHYDPCEIMEAIHDCVPLYDKIITRWEHHCTILTFARMGIIHAHRRLLAESIVQPKRPAFLTDTAYKLNALHEEVSKYPKISDLPEEELGSYHPDHDCLYEDMKVKCFDGLTLEERVVLLFRAPGFFHDWHEVYIRLITAIFTDLAHHFDHSQFTQVGPIIWKVEPEGEPQVPYLMPEHEVEYLRSFLLSAIGQDPKSKFQDLKVVALHLARQVKTLVHACALLTRIVGVINSMHITYTPPRPRYEAVEPWAPPQVCFSLLAPITNHNIMVRRLHATRPTPYRLELLHHVSDVVTQEELANLLRTSRVNICRIFHEVIIPKMRAKVGRLNLAENLS